MDENELAVSEKFTEIMNNFSKSITLLFEHNKLAQGLMLFYSMIDQLAWLSSKEDFSDSRDFKKWVRSYLNLEKLNCSEHDLWNDRCALVHMGTSKSKQFNSAINVQLGFYNNIAVSDEKLSEIKSSYDSPTQILDLGILVSEFNLGFDKFIWEISKDPSLRNSVFEKVQIMKNIWT